jgi:hypothetical protein
VPVPDLHPVNPAGQVVAREMGRMADATERASRVSGDESIEVRQDATGVGFHAFEAEEFWAKITSGPTSNKYAWTQVIDSVSGGVLTWGTPSGVKAGTTSVYPAYEINNNGAVPANVIVRMWRGTGEYYYFDYCCT